MVVKMFYSIISYIHFQSSEEGDTSLPQPQHTRKVRPKSENLDHNFSQRMEFFASPKNLRGEETRVRFSSEERSGISGSGSGPHIKGSVKWPQRPSDCDSDSDQSRPAISLVVTDVDRDMNAG